MSDDRLITIAIHTYQKATILKSILENEGIEVALQNVNLIQPVVSSGVRVRIHESDLPKALHIIENTDMSAQEEVKTPSAGKDEPQKVLVPVDFSDHSIIACQVAFRFARSYKAEIVVLHSYISPTIASTFQLSDNLDFDFENVADEEVRLGIEEASQKQLDKFADTLRRMVRDGELPPVKFTTQLIDDVAEDAINDVAKEIRPLLIVMGTRGAGQKERDMVGSVTAEVLDTCRYPVFTVPNTLKTLQGSVDSHVVFFCDYEQSDLIALDLFYRLFPSAHFHVTLMNVPSKRIPIDMTDISNGLKSYCDEHLGRFTFDIQSISINDMETEFQEIEKKRHIDFIAVPNKKRNIFSRLFNPGLAHRLLFHADIPMIVLPI